MLGTIPKTFSNDTLDLSSVDSMSLDEHIEIKIPESRARENRLMAQNNFVENINEKTRTQSHSHLSVENGAELLQKLHNHIERNAEREGHMHRSHSHASMKKQLTPNGVGHMNGHHEHRDNGHHDHRVDSAHHDHRADNGHHDHRADSGHHDHHREEQVVRK